MINDLIKELKNKINESDWIKIKFNGLMSLLSLIFLVVGVCACTIGVYFTLAPLDVFGVILSILGLIGLICFIIDISEIIHSL